ITRLLDRAARWGEVAAPVSARFGDAVAGGFQTSVDARGLRPGGGLEPRSTRGHSASGNCSRKDAWAVANSWSEIVLYGESIRSGKSSRPGLSFSIVLS